jgi:hypothetical protein
MCMTANRHAVAADMTAPLVYLKRMDGRPRSYTYEPPPGTPWRTGVDDVVAVAVRDVRPIARHLSLDSHGFALVPFKTDFTRFDDAQAIKGDYYPQVIEFVRRATGAAKVIAFDHNVRSSAVEGRAATGVREPAKRVHADFTLASGPKRARAELDAAGEDAARWLAGRYQLVNLWRPIVGPVESMPLALLDGRSVAANDLVLTDLVHPTRTGEIYSVVHNPAHRWYYVPAMRTDEALLIKCFDSDPNAPVRLSPHGAFEDPASPAGAQPRQSIEVRTLALFGS